MNNQIAELHQELSSHPLFQKLNCLENISIFMKYHSFAVWDFMSLLKSLQQKLTCVTLPWVPSPYPAELVRLINEIVLGEESDLDQYGEPTSHFELYLKAMQEVGCSTSLISDFLNNQNFSLLPREISDMVQFHLDLAQNGSVEEVSSSFFYGREKLIPTMFDSIVKVLENSSKGQAHYSTLIYYLKRHIEVDGEDHGPKALRCLNILLDTDEKREKAHKVAIQSLRQRRKLWDFIDEEIKKRQI
jgi:hypothetical protein